MTSSTVINAMTVDVEDYFQVSAFESVIREDDWTRYPARVEYNTRAILALFEQHGIKATFFTLAWVAQRYPGLVRDIVAAGHELASHGMKHVRIIHQTPEEFGEDVRRSRTILEDTAGVEICGYRAASYSVSEQTPWVHDLLAEAGYRYSSSVYPGKHDLYGIPGAPRFAYRAGAAGLLEVPITTIELFGRRFPCGGGGFFRLYPYRVSRAALTRINRDERQSAVFYFHPWEIDPEQPRIREAGARARFRHYLNLSRTRPRLEALLRDFAWGRMDQVFL